MLNELLKLYKKGSKKTPLEDFTTEAFVGLLKLEPKIRVSFLKEILKIDLDNVTIRTQVHYPLKSDDGCIVDVVIEGNKFLCFIENKVNSKEGKRQLKRYGEVLTRYKEDRGYDTKLFYCTKYHDPKSYEGHDFKQIRWFEIADHLAKSEGSTMVQEFYTFLKTHNMTMDFTFSQKKFDTLENLFDTYELINEYLDRVKPLFSERFSFNGSLINGVKMKQIKDYNRLIYSITDIVGEGGFSELKFGFQLGSKSIYVGIYIGHNNSCYKDILEKKDGFKKPYWNSEVLDHGIIIERKRGFSELVEDPTADAKIANWFGTTFDEFRDIIEGMSELDWKLKLQPKEKKDKELVS